MSRWFITLSFTTFMLASISVQSADICKQQDRVCAEQNNSGDCIRYENTFICYTDREDKGRCDAGASALSGCEIKSETCTSTENDICLEKQTEVVCMNLPSGDGITVSDPMISVIRQ